MSLPTKPATSIDDLPPEMICELFEYLQPKDLAACSMVNKRWHSIYGGFRMHRLVAVDYDNWYYDLGKWYNSNQAIREERSHLKIFRLLAEKPLLSNFKHLALSGELDLNELNRFRQLVHLEIKIGFSSKKKFHLNLPRLKVLVFHHNFSRFALSIDCAQLSTLVYYSEADVYYNEAEDPNLLDVKHPETIRKLETNWLGQKLAPFKNVECLVTEVFDAISKATLRLLPGLRELRYIRSIERVLNDHRLIGRFRTVDRMKRTLSEFMDDAKKLRGPDFQLTFSGFQLTKVNVDQIDFEPVDERFGRAFVGREYVYMKNYQLIEPGALPFVYYVDYNSLLSSLTGEFPRCFSKKFTGIERVKVTAEVQDANQFLWFLKSLRSLRSLDLENAALSQEFYDQLPASASSLAKLFLGAGRPTNEPQLNFDFIDKLSCLLYLYIGPTLSLESLTSLVRSLDKLVECALHVRPKGNRFDIEKVRGLAVWKINGEYTMKNLDEIVNFFKGLQDDTPPINPASD